MSVIRNQKQLHYFSVFKEKVFFKKKHLTLLPRTERIHLGVKSLELHPLFIYLFDGSLP